MIFLCGHAKTPENSTSGKYPGCRLCRNAYLAKRNKKRHFTEFDINKYTFDQILDAIGPRNKK